MKLPLLDIVKKMSGREKLMAGAGALMLVLVGADHFLIGPWFKDLDKARKDIRRIEDGIATHQRLLSRKPQLEEQVSQYRDYLREAGSADQEMAKLIREVEMLGSSSQVTISTINPLPPTTSLPYQAFSLEIKCVGTLHQAIHFLYLLETSQSLFEIDRAAVSLLKRGESQLQLALRLTSTAIQQDDAPAEAETSGKEPEQSG